MTRRTLPIALVALCLIAPGARRAHAAPPALPETVTYQALLLDDLGEPRTGNVDLTLRIFDDVTAGVLLYSQTLLAVPLTDGVFTVEIGPTGAASDTPEDPATTSLLEALTGDLGPVGAGRFLEVTVGVDGPLTRTPVRSVPYAMNADRPPIFRRG